MRIASGAGPDKYHLLISQKSATPAPEDAKVAPGLWPRFLLVLFLSRYDLPVQSDSEDRKKRTVFNGGNRHGRGKTFMRKLRGGQLGEASDIMRTGREGGMGMRALPAYVHTRSALTFFSGEKKVSKEKLD
jgi:hypothetical protein